MDGQNAIFTLVVVGLNILDEVTAILRELCINPVNEGKPGKIGNFRTLTYFLNLTDDSVIETRKALISRMSGQNSDLVPMYPHGNWMTVYVFYKYAIK